MHIERDQIKTLIVLSALALVFILGLWLPRRAKEVKLRQQIELCQSQLGFDRKDVQELGRLYEQVAELNLAVNRARKYVPQEHELADLLRDLSAQMNTQHATDQEIQTKAVVKGKDYNTIPLTLRFRGTFLSAFGFIDQAESMRRLARINKLYLDGDPQRPKQSLVVRIEMDTFAAPEAKSP